MISTGITFIILPEHTIKLTYSIRQKCVALTFKAAAGTAVAIRYGMDNLSRALCCMEGRLLPYGQLAIV